VAIGVSILRQCIIMALAAFLTGCGDDCCVGPPVTNDVDVRLEFTGLRALDPALEGTYEAWAIGSDGSIRSAGRFVMPADGRVTVVSPIENPQHVMVTVEPPGDDDAMPSPHKILGGQFTGTVAPLGIDRYVTGGIPLETTPGGHVLFTPSDNAQLGYPSYEDAGIWLFNIFGDTVSGSFFLTFTPLTVGWAYEGWVVRDYGTPNAIWLSYGKFTPNTFKKQNGRDDTGVGPYSGQLDYRQWNPLEIVMPGDDWVANPYGYPLPGSLTDADLPLDLNGNAGQGIMSRWTHVITIEPWGPDREPEMPWLARPFLLRPYRNAIGEATPDLPRTIEYHPELLPTGTATILSGGT
jgi:hypothetical protein